MLALSFVLNDPRSLQKFDVVNRIFSAHQEPVQTLGVCAVEIENAH